MRYKGNLIPAPASDVVVFPRQSLVNGELVQTDLVFTLTPIVDFYEFNTLCPEPTPPPTLEAGGKRGFDFDSKTFKEEHTAWHLKKLNWIFLKTLEHPDITWETVSMTDPSTWDNWGKELQDSAKLTPTQASYLYNRTIVFNGIDEAKMQEARARFLLSTRQAATV